MSSNTLTSDSEFPSVPSLDYGNTFMIQRPRQSGKSLNRSFVSSFERNVDVMNLTDTNYEVYDYDRDEAMNTFYWDELLPPLLIYCFTLIIGLVGNCLIIYTVLRFRGMKTTTNVFLASLASADLLLLLICIPVKTAKVFSFTWTLGWFLCKSVYYLQNVSVFCSVLTLTAMSLERYYAIVFPFRSQYLLTVRQAQKVTALVWGISVLLASPILVLQVHSRVGMNVEAYWCHRDWSHVWRWRAYETYMLLLVLIIPVIVMTFAYTTLAYQLGHVYGQRQAFLSATQVMSKMETHPLNNTRISSRHGTDRDMRQVVRMLVLVVVLFIISWSPLLITNVLWSWGFIPVYNPHAFYKHLFNAVHLLAYSNSCINPVVYGFLSKNFRQSFWAALCPCLRRQSSTPSNQISLSRTRHNSNRDSGYLGAKSSRATYV